MPCCAVLHQAEIKKGNTIKERAVSSDYLEAPPRTQPSCLQTMAVAAGVTLRQGGAAKAGPPRPKAQLGSGASAGMTREEHQRFVANQQHQQRQQQQQQAAQKQAPQAAAAGGAAGRSRPPSGLQPLAGAGGGGGGQEGSHGAAAADVFEGYPSSPGIMAGAKPREHAPLAPVKPPTPDLNPLLVGASDWGMAMGSGGRLGGSGGLPISKPSDRQRELEGGWEAGKATDD